MKKNRLILRTVILLILGGAIVYTLYANITKDKNEIVEVGKLAPDFVLTDMNGERHQLSDYKGQGVFLNFWATWCKPCEREMPFMESQYEQYKDKGVQILAVNIGESEVVVNDFIKKYGLSFPVLRDKEQEVLNAYGVNPLPITFLIDKDGKVVRIHTGEILKEDFVKELMEEIKP